MTITSSLRRRWGRWCGLLAVCCAGIYGAERYLAKTAQKDLAKEFDLPEPELTPTLVQSRELPTIATGPVHSKSKAGWDPQPQWRFEMTGSLRDQAHKSDVDALQSTPIPEAFPLPPRFKKGPPVVGNAVADPFSNIEKKSGFDPIRQPRVDSSLAQDSAAVPENSAPTKMRKVVSSTSVTTFSPFVSPSSNADKPLTKPNVAFPANSKSQDSGLLAESSNSKEVWPDQTFTPGNPATTVSANPASPFDVATPNLLTNARISVPDRTSDTAPRGYSPAPAASTTPLPATGRYILQPMKN